MKNYEDECSSLHVKMNVPPPPDRIPLNKSHSSQILEISIYSDLLRLSLFSGQRAAAWTAVKSVHDSY